MMRNVSAAILLSLAFATAAPAATPEAATSAHATRVVLLGTYGGPKASEERSEPASLLVVAGTPYLIDAGAGVDRQIAAYGLHHSDIRTIFITHHHIDHNAGLVPLISLIWFDRAWYNLAGPPVQIYGPPATEFLVHTALDYLSVSERIFRAGVPAMMTAAPMFSAHDIDHDGLVYQDERVRVTAAENTHFHFKSESPATGQDRSYSYRFDTAKGAVVFTGDTGPSEAVTNLARGADVLVSEVCVCAGKVPTVPDPSAPPATLDAQIDYHMDHEHLTPEQVGIMASRAHARVVVLTHFVPGDGGVDVARFTAGVQKYFNGEVIAGKDLLTYDLP